MSKLTDKMFGKNVKLTINYVDLDNDNQILDTDEISGKAGQSFDYQAEDKIKTFADQGYALAANDIADRSEGKKYGQDDETLAITFHHQHVTVTAQNPSFGFTKEQLEKKIEQVVHYQGAASRTPENSSTFVTFNRHVEVDRVTGQMVQDLGWQPERQNFMIIGTPTLPGFVPDQVAVGGESVTADDDNKEYTVNFEINKVPSSLTQTAVIKFVDLSDDNKVITVDKLTGQPNMPIEYDPKKKIDRLQEEGFLLIHNGFNAAGDIQFFGNADSYEPVFIITMKYTAVAVDQNHPNEQVDPSNYIKDSQFTIKFVGAGEQTPKAMTQTAHWSRTVTMIPSTGQLIQNGFYNTPWKPDKEEYGNVNIPVVEGYHTKEKTVKALPVSEEDQVLTVTYEENGRIVPVDETGAPIANAPRPQFESDPDDPSKVRDDQIIPDVEGYSCDLMTITPDDPGKDLDVAYKSNQQSDTMYINLGKNKPGEQAQTTGEDNETTEPGPEQPTAPAEPTIAPTEAATAPETVTEPVQETQQTTAAPTQPTQATSANKDGLKDQVAIVNFIDVDHNGASLTSSGPLVGKPGDSINDLYSTDIPLKVIKKAGYHVVFNNFDSDGFVQRFDNNDLMTQIFTIGVSKKKEEPKPDITALARVTGQGDDELDDTKVAALKETKDQLEKIRPTLVPKNNGDNNSQTVTRLLDICTALLNLVFVMGKGDNKDK